MSGRLAVVRSVAGHPHLRRLAAAHLLFALCEYGSWLTITVFAYRRGGVAEVGWASFVQLVPAAVVAPVAAYAADRFRRDRVVAAGIAAVAVAAAATGAIMLAGGPAPLVYAAGAVAAASMTVVRPALFALLPAVSEDARSLTAANAVIELVDNVGVFGGPALAGAALAVLSPGAVFMGFAACAAVAALAVATMRIEPARVRPTGDLAGAAVLAELRGGVALLARDARLTVAVGVVIVVFVVLGASDVFFVAIALDLLDRGEALAGLLAAVAGIGALVGAASSITLIGRRRLAGPIVVAALVAGLPLAAIALVPTTATAIAGLATSGAGLALLTVAGRTFVQRTSPDDVLARVLGVLEGGAQIGLACGSLLAGVVAGALGVQGALWVVAAVLPVAALAALGSLRRADDDASRTDPDTIRWLRGFAVFEPLGPAALEQLALNLRPVKAAAGDWVIRAGERGDRFYAVEGGRLEVVSVDGEHLRDLGPGDHFGEIALLRDVARTASVRATSPCRLRSVGRSVFLEAVTGHPVALHRAHEVADELDPPRT